MSEAAELLADARTLRRRARADRHAYWLPLVFFGLATAAAAPLYVERVHDQEIGPGDLYPVGVDPRVGSYWTITLLAGALLSVWWYRRRGRLIGIESQVGPALVAATLFVITYLALEMVPGAPQYLWPLWMRNFTALLVLAVGLLGLAWAERSAGLAVVAAVFAAAAVLANTYNVENLVYEVGLDLPSRLQQLPNLLLPAAVLLVGGAGAGLSAWRAR